MSSAEQVQTKSARKSGKKKKPREKVTTLSPCPEFEKEILNEILEDLKSEGIISTAPSETVSSQSLSESVVVDKHIHDDDEEISTSTSSACINAREATSTHSINNNDVGKEQEVEEEALDTNLTVTASLTIIPKLDNVEIGYTDSVPEEQKELEYEGTYETAAAATTAKLLEEQQEPELESTAPEICTPSEIDTPQEEEPESETVPTPECSPAESDENLAYEDLELKSDLKPITATNDSLVTLYHPMPNDQFTKQPSSVFVEEDRNFQEEVQEEDNVEYHEPALSSQVQEDNDHQQFTTSKNENQSQVKLYTNVVLIEPPKLIRNKREFIPLKNSWEELMDYIDDTYVNIDNIYDDNNSTSQYYINLMDLSDTTINYPSSTTIGNSTCSFHKPTQSINEKYWENRFKAIDDELKNMAATTARNNESELDLTNSLVDLNYALLNEYVDPANEEELMYYYERQEDIRQRTQEMEESIKQHQQRRILKPKRRRKNKKREVKSSTTVENVWAEIKFWTVQKVRRSWAALKSIKGNIGKVFSRSSSVSNVTQQQQGTSSAPMLPPPPPPANNSKKNRKITNNSIPKGNILDTIINANHENSKLNDLRSKAASSFSDHNDDHDQQLNQRMLAAAALQNGGHLANSPTVAVPKHSNNDQFMQDYIANHVAHLQNIRIPKTSGRIINKYIRRAQGPRCITRPILPEPNPGPSGSRRKQV